MKNKKIWLSLGAITTTIAPIAAIVACSSSSSMGDAEIKAIDALSKPEAKRIITNIWLDEVLNYKDSKVKGDVDKKITSYLKYYMAEQIRKDKLYLSNLVTTWRGIIGSVADLSKYKMDATYESFSEWENAMKPETFNTLIKFVLKNNQIAKKTDFIVDAKKAVVTWNYLTLSKANWMSVFGNKNKEDLYDGSLDKNKSVWDLINDKNFPLIVEGMKKHYGYYWNINIKSDKLNRDFINTIKQKNKGTIASTILRLFAKTGQTGELGERIIYNGKQIDPALAAITASTDEGNALGFKGITSIPNGKGDLNFNWDNKDNWINKKEQIQGFIIKDNLKSENDTLKYIEDDQKDIDLTYYSSIIPVYNNNKISFKFKDAHNSDGLNNKDALISTMIMNNSSLYENALKYYTNKSNPIVLDFSHDKFIEKKMIDLGFKFIKK